jgi:phosphotransferase system  glucose/maltose/N-acetylglucosamine-specific IIC component
LCRDLAIAVLYTLLVVALAKAGVIGPIQDTIQKIQNFVHKW